MNKFQIAICILFISGCASTKLKLHDWEKLPKEHYTIPPYARYLAHYKIALDPGHGGNAHLPGYKRGPTGKREAVMNLNVARFLKEFLENAGATVFLTRDDDRFVSLQDRVELAENTGCYFMLSLHHNASENPETNFTAIFYHLTPEYSPVSMDLSRNIYFGLVDALHLPQIVDDGLLTDRIIYPAGFGLLRRSEIPTVLLESSFYSNPKEEKRLMNLRYNRREAYGIFLGLARWAAGGIPSTRKRSPIGISQKKQPTIEYEIFDGITERGGRNPDQQLIFAHSVSAKIDGENVPVMLSADKRFVSFRPDSSLANGYHTLQVDIQNMFKNHNFPRPDTLIISAPTDSSDFIYATQYLPADSLALMPITLTLLDKDGEPVWDSTDVYVRVNKGSIAPSHPRLKNGQTTVYYKSDSEIGLVYVTATTDSHTDTLLLSLTPPGQSWVLSGAVIDDSTGVPIANATVALSDSVTTLTDQNGVYFMLDPAIGIDTLLISRDGYATTARELQIDSSSSHLINFRLKANLDGLLHDQVIILDAALGDSMSGGLFTDSLSAAQANLLLIRQLADTLLWAGAKPILVRENAAWLSSQDRIRKVNQMSEGWYLKFSYEKWESDSVLVQATIYPANKVGERIATSFITVFSERPNTRGAIVQKTDIPEVTYTNKTAVALVLRCRKPNSVAEDLKALFRAIVKYYSLEKVENTARLSSKKQLTVRSRQ